MHQSKAGRSGILAAVAALVVAGGSLPGGQPTRAATGDPVLLNEALLSHTGTPDNAEFVELFGRPGESLAGLALVAVEGDSSQSPGTVAFRLDFAPGAHLGGNGFYLVGNPGGLGPAYGVTPDVAIGNDAFANGSQTLALVEAASAPLLGAMVTGGEVVRDVVGVTDGGAADRFFFGTPAVPTPVVGPDPAGFMPPGVRRTGNGIDTDSAPDWLITGNNLDASHSPTAASPYNFLPTARCGGPVTTVAGTAAAAPVSASDVDGTMVAFSLAVVPPTTGVTIANVVLAVGAGGTASANVAVGSTTPAGSYGVTVTATNADATPQQATCQLALTVEPAPPDPTPTPTPDPAGPSTDALDDMLTAYVAAGDVAAGKAHLLTDRLARIETLLARGQDAAALAQLQAFANQAQGLSPRWVTPWAADSLSQMAGAVVADLASGG